MSWIGFGLALLLPTLCGYGLWNVTMGRPRGFAAHAAALGAGYLFGAMLLGAVLAWCNGLTLARLPWVAGGSMVLLIAACVWAVRSRGSDPGITAVQDDDGSTRARRAIAIVTTGALAVCLVLLLIQAILLPTLGWDAWNVWLAKPKAWFHLGLLAPAVAPEIWAMHAGEAITTVGWPYPEALPRYALWLAASAGAWNEAALHLAWPLAWASLGLAIFGYLRLAAVGTVQALLSAAAVLLLPMLTTHAALAGYADLWMAAMLLLGAVHVYRWMQSKRTGEAAAALACAALLPAIKAEGAIWLICLVLAALLARTSARRALLVFAGAIAIWAAALPWDGLRLPLPGLGWVRLGWATVEMERFGKIDLTWQHVGDEVLQTLFLLPNWSLLWYATPVLLALSWRAIPTNAGLRALSCFLTLGFGFLFVLFFFTDASAWAENFTSVNRVLMHIVPTTVFWLSLCWAGRRGPHTAGSNAA
jgi:hypothetical protein